MGKFVVNGAIDATSHITIKNGADLYLQAPASAPDDSGDLIFTKYDGTEQGRLWISGGVGMIRFSSSDSSKTLIHSGNYTSYTVTKTGGGASGTWGINVTGQATYVRDSYNGSNITITYGKSGQSSTSWLASWNGYELGAIAPSSITAGWASGASYSNSSNALASTGWGNGNFTYLQTSGDFYGNSGWSHYLISNHGNGETYYNYVIALPFWDSPRYQRMSGGNAGGWHRFHTTENVIIQSSTPGAGFYGQIWLKV